MAKELTFDNILDDGLEFGDLDEAQEEQTASEETPENKDDNFRITEDLNFDDDLEGVGDGDTEKAQGDADGSEGSGTSPITFSSIAEALVEEGILPDLETEAKEVKSAADFVGLVKKHIDSQLDESQRRINAALEVGMEPDEIKVYEGNLKYLNSITEANINDESEEGENLRKRLIYNDYINKGFKKEKALAWMNRSISNGTDKEDAKEALESNIEHYSGLYKEKVDKLKAEAEEEKARVKQQSEELKKSILEDEKIFGSLQIDKTTRSRIYDNISKPVYRDKDTGDTYTAVQKYQKDHPTEFLKFVGMCFTLTDGFKEIDRLASGMAKKEVKNKMRTLEQKMNGTARLSDGTLDFLGGLRDPESSSGRKIKLDI